MSIKSASALITIALISGAIIALAIIGGTSVYEWLR